MSHPEDNSFPADTDSTMDDTLSALVDKIVEKNSAEDNTSQRPAKTPKLTTTDDFDTPLYAKLLGIDPEFTLTIFRHFDNRGDPVVAEYIANLLAINFIPQIPKNDPKAIPSVLKCKLSSSTIETVIPLIMYYFQTRNFRNNIIEATANKKSVFNVNQRPFMPAFQFTPDQHLHKVTALKESFAMQLQGIHRESAEFISEFLIIRATKCIRDDIKVHLTDTDEITTETQNQLCVLFLKCQIEFVHKFNIKNTDWELYTSKVNHTEPKWRKDDLSPPTTMHNRYATALISKVHKGHEKLDTEVVKSEYENFLREGMDVVEKSKINRSNLSQNNRSRMPPQQQKERKQFAQKKKWQDDRDNAQERDYGPNSSNSQGGRKFKKPRRFHNRENKDVGKGNKSSRDGGSEKFENIPNMLQKID